MGERRASLGAGSRGRRSKRALDEHGELVAAGLLPDIDFCVHALQLSARGRVVKPEHQAACAVCTRRWRITEAELQGWPPMRHDHAEDVMTEMAAIFVSSERDGRYRAFYAHLARCPECERRLAELTFDSTPAAAERRLQTATPPPAS